MSTLRVATWMLLAALAAAACRSSSGVSAAACLPGASAPCFCSSGRPGAQICQADNSFASCTCGPSDAAVAGCVPGQSAACGCANGSIGAQTCLADRTYSACACVGQDASASAGCAPGRAIACACFDGRPGAQICQADQSFGACVCAESAGASDASGIDSIGAVDAGSGPGDAGAGDAASPAGQAVSAISPMVLDFPDPVTADIAVHVNHGQFWADDVDLGTSFFWDAYVAPRTPGYLVSDGYGGAHAMLWGPILSSDNQMIFQGNVWNGTGSTSYAAIEGPAPGEWGHHAIGMVKDISNQVSIITYWNGIAVGITPFIGVSRHSGDIGNGQGVLYVMGSSHQNLGGELAALRVWDRASPFATANNPAAAFIPERTFASQLADRTPVDFLADYTRPAVEIADLSPVGYSGGGLGPPSRHPGRILNAPVGFVSPDQSFAVTLPSLGPLATWVVDSSCPYGVGGQLPPNSREQIPAPAPPPAGALAFDSFGRRAQNFLWQQIPSLGKTEGGTLGPLVWNVGVVDTSAMPSPWGILNGRAVFLERQAAIAWVDVGVSDQDVRINRFTSSNHTGLAFRVQDHRNFWYAFVPSNIGVATPGGVHIGYFQDGVSHDLASYPFSIPLWLTLRVQIVGSTLTVYTDYSGNNEFVPIGTMGNATQLQGATGAGLTGAINGTSASSFWRGDNFTVCGAGGC